MVTRFALLPRQNFTVTPIFSRPHRNCIKLHNIVKKVAVTANVKNDDFPKWNECSLQKKKCMAFKEIR